MQSVTTTLTQCTMRIHKYFGLSSLLSLLIITSCEKDDSQLTPSDQPAATSPLDAAFALEDGDHLELAPDLAFSDVDIIKGVDMPEKAEFEKGLWFRSQPTVYTQSNAATANQIIAFAVAADGTLHESARFSTGGKGSGDGLGNQGAVHISQSGFFLYAVNAGDHSLSAFFILPNGNLYLLSVAKLKGQRPVSVTSYRNLVYVVNAGTDDIEGLYLGLWGRLYNLPGSRRSLSATATSPAQISFKNNGRALLVTEKATQTLSGYAIGNNGLPSAGRFTPAANPTPFGFDFGWGGRAVVTEAVDGNPGASMVTAYRLSNSGRVYQLDESLALSATAACWAVLHPSSGQAYVTNTGSDEISSLLKRGNTIVLSNNGKTTPAVSGPIDAGIDARGEYLYVLLGGSDELATYHIGDNGALRQIDKDGDLPVAVTGLAVR